MSQKPANLSPELWRQIRREHTKQRKQQPNLLPEEEIWKLEIERKLTKANNIAEGALELNGWFTNFFRCGREAGYIMCASCGDGKVAPYRCSQKWCPVCNWRIALKRKELMEVITRGMPQLKHVVLTQRNFEVLSPGKIDQSRSALFAIRRQKIFDKKAHGCASLEFTNETAGWHMHWHLLLTQKWIEADKLSIAWGKLVGQEFAIVKVKAIAGDAYLAELLKYVVKGSEMAKWAPEQIVQFIETIRGKRCFSTFGKFREIAKFARTVIRLRKSPCTCGRCGSTELVYGESESHCNRLVDRIYG